MTRSHRNFLLFCSAVLITGWWFSRPTRAVDGADAAPSSALSKRADHVPFAPFTRGKRNPVRAAVPATPSAASTNLMDRLLAGDFPTLTLDKVAGYLRENRRSADSLLGAFHATRDPSLLREAMERFPNDPRVAQAAYFNVSSGETSSEERSQWLATWQRTDPDNALPNYLAAGESFKTGDVEAALAAVEAASTRSLADHNWESIQNAEDAWRSAGYSEADAKTMAMSTLTLGHLAPLKKVAFELADLAAAYSDMGEAESAMALRHSALALAGQLQHRPANLIGNELVGIAMERKILGAFSSDTPYNDTGLTVQERIDSLMERKTALAETARLQTEIFPHLSDKDRISLMDRIKTSGETAAWAWALKKYREP